MMPFLWFLAALILSFAWPAHAQFNLNSNPSRVVGHARLNPIVGSANLVEGREFNNPQSIAIDTSVSPPLLYVTDTGNHRILGWRNATAFGNGAPADLVIGQRNFYSTSTGGPGTTFSSGFRNPAAILVDRNGNLYVADTGNNRILRFPKPFSQTEQLPNLVIGQTNLNSNAANAGGLSARSLNTSLGLVFGGTMAFDTEGNLWAADTGNHRVLRYPASALGNEVSNGPNADIVLGQVDFNSQVSAGGIGTAANRIKRGSFNTPSSVVFDPQGRLFIADTLSRVLVFLPPFTTGKEAARLMGIQPAGQTNPCPGVTNGGDISVGNVESVVMIEGRPAVVDNQNNRILLYDAFDQWPAEPTPTTVVSPRAKSSGPVGQAAFCGDDPNRGQPQSGPDTLRVPSHGMVAGNELFVADSGNHRVLVFQVAGLGPNSLATRVLGQDAFHLNSVNLVEGRELFLIASSAQGTFVDGGVVVDTRSDPPHLYISDTFNNRVLGYRDVRRVRPGDKADIVIGQPDLQRTVPNYPSGDIDQPTSRNLRLPSGLALDNAGNLYVADAGNARVLRFPKPFEQTEQVANLVLGQVNFNTKITDPTARTMASPSGLTFAGDSNGLLVADVAHHRVLFFRGDPINFTSGQSAEKVFGQPDFVSVSSGGADNRMFAPRHISTDSFLRLYVADTGNSRILIFNSVLAAEQNPRATVILRQLNSGGSVANQPRAVWVSKANDEIWVGDDSNRVYRFPNFDALAANQNFTNFSISLPTGIIVTAVTQDAFGDLLVADSTNRVSIYYPGLGASNTANSIPRRALAPGTVVSVYRQGLEYSPSLAEAQALPLPTELGDVEVLFNDRPTPLYFVSPNQINFLTPMDAPTSGTAELQVVRKSTGQVLGVSPVEMAPASPGLFTKSRTGSGQIAAFNEDNTVNDSTNPISRSKIIQMFGTGQGFVPGAPPDGSAPDGPISTDEKPRVWVNTRYLDDSDILYSGLAPGLAGVWQINFRVPDSVPPGNAILVFVQLKSIFSFEGSQRTTIAVKQ